MNKYPKAFETWYHRHVFVQCLSDWQSGEYKQALFNAWKAGRRHQKHLPPTDVHNNCWIT